MFQRSSSKRGDLQMSGLVIRTGDLIEITISPPSIVPQLQEPVPLEGSALSFVFNGTPACVAGDEIPPPLRVPMPYTAPPFTEPGTGTLAVKLPAACLTTQTTTDGRPLLTQAGAFQVTFTVVEPAMQMTPGGPVSDTDSEKTGSGRFITTNEWVTAV